MWRSTLAALMLSACACLPASCAVAEPAVDISPADLEAFADGVVLTMMEEVNVAGTVIGVVEGGEVVLLKGYGHADVKSGTVVDPETTLFRPGSVTKLFTWVALMQLKGQGKIDLDTDVNKYLEGVEIPNTFSEPITIKHLMTHTPGFEDHVLGLFGRDESSLRPLTELLNDEMPKRVRPPGTYASYSNHGVAIAGLIVEQVSGEPWAEYIENHILEPLGMFHTTMRQPLPEHLADHMSVGYTFERGKFKQEIFEFVPAAPAGSASASASDMVRLVQMFLNEGEGNGARILSPELAREMRETLFRPVEDNNGLMHGFYETTSHGRFMIGHGGDTLWFHSELILMPDANVGWFISTNTATGPQVRAAFHKGFLDRYFQAPGVQARGSESAGFDKTDLARLTGTYGALRYAHDDLTKLIRLAGGIEIARSPDDELMLVAGSEVTYFEEIAPLTFKAVDDEGRVSFEMGDDGVATHLYLSAAPMVAFERLSGDASLILHRLILTVSGLVFAWILIVWTIQQFTRRWVLPAGVVRFRIAAFAMAVSVVAFVMGLFIVIGGPNDVVFGFGPEAGIVFLIPYVTMTLSVFTLLLYLPVIREQSIGFVSRVGYGLVAATGIAFTWFLTYWQLL